MGAVLLCSASTISRWKRRCEAEDDAFGRPRGRKRSGVHIRATLVVRWVLPFSTTDFQFARSRWSCEATAVLLQDYYRARVRQETVRLRLRSAGLVWRRPCLVIRPKYPAREQKLAEHRAMLHGLPTTTRTSSLPIPSG